MQSAVDRVMEAYTLMVTLTPDEQKVTRQRLERHLAAMDADEKALAVERLRDFEDEIRSQGGASEQGLMTDNLAQRERLIAAKKSVKNQQHEVVRLAIFGARATAGRKA